MSGAPALAPVVLEGAHVRLAPLAREHAGALADVVVPGDLCRHFPFPMQTRADVARFVDGALAARAAGSVLPFVQLDPVTGAVAGSTSYLAIELPHRRLEIGATFVGRAWQRTPLNTEAKRLLLAHAFETLDLLRVELKTDARNLASRRAMARLGLRQEGVFRRHMLCPDGSSRDTVWFAATREEWPALRARLDALLAGSEAPVVGDAPRSWSHRDGYVLDDDPLHVDADAAWRLLEGQYWTTGRTRAQHEAALAASHCFSLRHGDSLVGFARVLTDGATVSWLADVVVDPGHRGRGLGRWMLERIVGHPRFAGTRMLLVTRDAQPLYARVGFEAHPYACMRR